MADSLVGKLLSNCVLFHVNFQQVLLKCNVASSLHLIRSLSSCVKCFMDSFKLDRITTPPPKKRQTRHLETVRGSTLIIILNFPPAIISVNKSISAKMNRRHTVTTFKQQAADKVVLEPKTRLYHIVYKSLPLQRGVDLQEKESGITLNCCWNIVLLKTRTFIEPQ